MTGMDMCLVRVLLGEERFRPATPSNQDKEQPTQAHSVYCSHPSMAFLPCAAAVPACLCGFLARVAGSKTAGDNIRQFALSLIHSEAGEGGGVEEGCT